MDLTVPLPRGSYAWCSECGWRNDTEWCHKHGQAHMLMRSHIVHVFEAEAVFCGDIFIGGKHDEAYDCTRPAGHDGYHSHLRQLSWPPVSNSVDNS